MPRELFVMLDEYFHCSSHSFRLQVLELPSWTTIFWQCLLHRGIYMKLKFSLPLKEDSRRCLAYLASTDYHIHQDLLIWLIVQDASYHGLLMVLILDLRVLYLVFYTEWICLICFSIAEESLFFSWQEFFFFFSRGILKLKYQLWNALHFLKLLTAILNMTLQCWFT